MNLYRMFVIMMICLFVMTGCTDDTNKSSSPSKTESQTDRAAALAKVQLIQKEFDELIQLYEDGVLNDDNAALEQAKTKAAGISNTFNSIDDLKQTDLNLQNQIADLKKAFEEFIPEAQTVYAEFSSNWELFSDDNSIEGQVFKLAQKTNEIRNQIRLIETFLNKNEDRKTEMTSVSLSEKQEKRIKRPGIPEYLLPATLNSYEALKQFEMQIKLYKDAVMLGDKTLIAEAQQKGREAINKITMIVDQPDMGLELKDELKKLIDSMETFTLKAGEAYGKMCDDFDGSDNDTFDQTTVINLANETRRINEHLNHLSQRYASDLHYSISAANNYIRRSILYKLSMLFSE